MISSFEAGFSLQRSLDPGVFYDLTGTLLGSEEISWLEMVEAFHKSLDIYVCVLILDDSTASQEVRAIIARNYVRLDQITGQDLLVLSTVPPPEDWFRIKLESFRKLPNFASRFHAKEICMLGTKEGESSARFNSHKLVREFFRESLKPPALCYLQPTAVRDEPGRTSIEALCFDISGLRTDEALVGAFSYLAEIAKQKRRLRTDTFHLAKAAHALTNPRSLRWRNAAYKTLGVLDFVQKWMTKARELVS